SLSNWSLSDFRLQVPAHSVDPINVQTWFIWIQIKKHHQLFVCLGLCASVCISVCVPLLSTALIHFSTNLGMVVFSR
uniref:Uncharacterized protein n=1 Tax=Echeneis naucrates TaxID=173247 RepID=A0A665WRT9_ECHNA